MATDAGSITNTASVQSGTADPDPADNTASEVTTLEASADLSLTKTASPDPVVAGDELTYTITVANAGPSDAADVVVSDPLPSGTTFVSASEGGTVSAGIVTWSIASIASGSSLTLTLVVRIADDLEGLLTNVASVSSAITDPDPTDDTGSVSVVVDGPAPPKTEPVADLSVDKVADDDTPAVGQVVSYTITVSNAGPAHATGVAVMDALPDGLEFRSGKASQGDHDPESGTWEVGDLVVGQQETLEIEVTVTGEPGTSIDNVAEVTSADQDDPDGANDSSVAAVAIVVEQSEEPVPLAVTGGVVGPLVRLMLLCFLLGVLALIASWRLGRTPED
jgi:uncharacterized repeat protein (TIGR01451 family)